MKVCATITMDKIYNRGEVLEIDIVDIGSCAGTFVTKSLDNQRIVLFNVKYLEDGSVLKGYTNYYSSEITSIRRVTDELGIFLLNQTESDRLQLAAKKYFLIQKIDDKFHHAINDLNNYSHIGVGTDGIEKGRKSGLGILTLTTPKQIYLFDIQKLQRNAFDFGIKSLLENSINMKIIHDSRNLSDLLFHKYSIVLKHVYDTAVADVIITKYKKKSYPEQFKTLQECLTSYMGLSNVVENLNSTEYINDDESLRIQKVTAANNTYLHCLKDVMKNLMSASLERGFACYLNLDRQCDDFEAWTYKTGDEFPNALMKEL